MNKTSQNLILAVLLTVLLMPSLVSAQERPLDCCILNKTVTVDGITYEEGNAVGRGVICSLTGVAPDYETKKWGLICLLSSLVMATDWVFTFLMVFVTVMVIVGAYEFTTAAGSVEKVKKGKNYILYAMIGMVVALLSKGIPDIIGTLLGI